ncbi:MAG: protein-glutamate O-methyltransferase CheR [Actinomycetota bacterium]
MTLETKTAGAAAGTGGLNDDSLAFFCKLIDDRIGVQLQGKEYLIESRLQPLLREFQLDSAEQLVDRLRRGDKRIEAAAVEVMTTNETSFFRDQHPFEALATQLLPEMRQQTGLRTLNIWNGACSSGQESYTLAMTIHEHFPELAASGKAKILSTDVSPTMVERTKSGAYSRFEINRGLPASHAVRYFEQKGRSWVAKPELRNMIDARELNLLKPWVGLPKCDVVLLRNVLIYFTVDKKQDILRRIRTNVLSPHGCLILGASETTVGLDEGYESRRVGKSTFHFVKGAS